MAPVFGDMWGLHLFKGQGRPSNAMQLRHLSLTNFRNYARLELDLPPQGLILIGDNAQGKSNFLEAIYYLATTRSLRAGSDRELINWRTLAEDDLPTARLVAQVARARGLVTVEIAMMARGGPLPPGPPPLQGRGETGANGDVEPRSSLTKRIRLNEIVKRAADLIGQVIVVMFSPNDIDLVAGAPAGRRRYLDIASSQTDVRYMRALQIYNKVLTQRNHLLRLIRERRASSDQLGYWDDQLVEQGSYLIARRRQMLAALSLLAQPRHAQLSNGHESLTLRYLPSALGLGEGTAPETETERQVAEDGAAYDASERAAIAEAFRARLEQERRREIQQGVSLIGPHRDDWQLLANAIDLNVYGSRGQQRTAALSVRLAETEWMRQQTGEPPILLLDDVMSELDAHRRQQVLQSVLGAHQVIIAATELGDYAAEGPLPLPAYRVDNGRITPWEDDG